MLSSSIHHQNDDKHKNMAWVSSFQSKLDEMQSSIDSRLDKGGLAESMRKISKPSRIFSKKKADLAVEEKNAKKKEIFQASSPRKEEEEEEEDKREEASSREEEEEDKSEEARTPSIVREEEDKEASFVGASERKTEAPFSSNSEEERPKLVAALLALRLETLETQRRTLSTARSVSAAAKSCSERAKSFAKDAERRAEEARKETGKHAALKARRSAALATMESLRSDREVKRSISAFEATVLLSQDANRKYEMKLAQAERDGSALADAATCKLAAANKKINDAEKRIHELEKKRAIEEDDEDDEEEGSSHRKKKSSLSKRELIRELEAAEKRMRDYSGVASDALADLDRERSSRKARELAALKSLNEQLQGARKDAKRQAQDLERRLEETSKESKDRRKASDREVADLRDTLAQCQRDKEEILATAKAKAATAAREAAAALDAAKASLAGDHAKKSKYADDRNSIVERQLVDQARLVSTLREQIDANNQKLANSKHQLQQLQTKLQQAPLRSQTSVDLEENAKENANASTPKRHQNKQQKGRALARTSRAIFLLYAIALHVLTYLAFFHCGFVEAAVSSGGGGTAS